MFKLRLNDSTSPRHLWDVTRDDSLRAGQFAQHGSAVAWRELAEEFLVEDGGGNTGDLPKQVGNHDSLLELGVHRVQILTWFGK